MSPPFSHRLDWNLTENDLANAEARARREAAAGDAAGVASLVDLTVSNPTVVGLPDVSPQLARALGAAHTGTYAPAPRGSARARQAIAGFYRTNAIAIDPERLVLTASSSESYSYLFKLLCDPGDVVLVPSPGYPLFDYLARLDAVRPVAYRTSYGQDRRWHVDLHSVDDALAEAAREGRRVRAIVVVSPNNPTGAVLDEGDAAALDDRCAALPAALIADEVFADFIRRPSSAQVRCLAARKTRAATFSLGGLSKSCGLPQTKLGWILVGGPVRTASRALARLELVADTYLSVNSATERALPDLLALGATFRRDLTSRLRANEAQLERALGPASALAVLPGDGGWSAVLRVPAIASDEAWALTLLERDRVLVQPGFFFDLDHGTCLVISLIVPEAEFATGIDRIVARVETMTSGAA